MFHHRGIILAVVLVLGFGPVVWAYLRRKGAEASFARLLERFRPRSDRPALQGGISCIGAWDGEIAPGKPVTLLLCTRAEGTATVGHTQVPVTRRLVGAILPPGPDVTDERVARQRDVVAAYRTSDGGMAVVWKGLASGARASAHLASL